MTVSVLNGTVPLFVFQWLFDEVQLHAENLATPITRPQWEHIHQMGNVLRNSLHNVTYVFVFNFLNYLFSFVVISISIRRVYERSN